jgi:hypothetical protein
VAGYFTPRAVDRKGPGTYALRRAVRLGVPLLLFPLLVHHPLLYLIEGRTEGFWSYLGGTLASGRIEVGHLWFVGHLLVYGALYALVRRLTPPPEKPVSLPSRGPSITAMLVFALLLAVATGVVHIWFPHDRWVSVLPVLPVEFAHLPQYVALFTVGILTRRRAWFRNISRRQGRFWLGLGLLLVVVAFVSASEREKAVETVTDANANGNSFGRAALGELWEALICVSLCAGLLALFRRRFNRQGALLAALARASYATYILHLPLVVGLQLAVRPLDRTPLEKFALVTACALPLSFLAGIVVGRLPLLRQFL